MENSKKAIVFLLAAGLWCCRYDRAHADVAADTRNSASQGKLLPHEDQQPIRNGDKKALRAGLFQDAEGEIYLKVKNRGLRHPSKVDKQWADSVFLSQVFESRENRSLPLKDVIDLATFSSKNESGTYYTDYARIYVYSSNPHPVQFFTLERGGEKFLDSGNEYLLHRGALYHQGVKVDGLNNEALAIVRVRRSDGPGFYEFITDREKIYHGAYPLDQERLGFLDGLSEQDKKTISSRYGLK